MAVDRTRIVNALTEIAFARVYKANPTRLQAKQASQGLTDAEWDVILTSYRTNNAAQLGEVLIKRIDEHLVDLAKIQVDTVWLATDTLSLDNLDKVL